MERRTALIIALAALLLGAVGACAQSLRLKGPGVSKALSAQDLAALPHVEVKISEHGATATYQGVAVTDLTALVGAPQGEALRGPALADVLIVTAKDGYRVALALAETDPAMREERIILADQKDGQPLDAREGPFRLIVEGDKRPARSARQVTSLELRAEP
jgi:hypothetical protein